MSRLLVHVLVHAAQPLPLCMYIHTSFVKMYDLLDRWKVMEQPPKSTAYEVTKNGKLELCLFSCTHCTCTCNAAKTDRRQPTHPPSPPSRFGGMRARTGTAASAAVVLSIGSDDQSGEPALTFDKNTLQIFCWENSCLMLQLTVVRPHLFEV